MLENFAAIGLGGLRRFNVGELAAGSVFKILFCYPGACIIKLITALIYGFPG
jgi:hypothetical protein